MPYKAPSGYYLASEAAARLGISQRHFNTKIHNGSIPCQKQTPPGKKVGFYKIEEIEAFARYQDMLSAMNDSNTCIFKRVENEQELRGIVDLCVQIYGRSGTPTFEQRLAIWQHNPEVYHIVKQGDIVVGYISLTWLHNDLLSAFMKPCGKDRSEILKKYGNAEYLYQWQEGQPIDHLFASISVRTGFSAQLHRTYASILLLGAVRVLENFAQRGMPVHWLYAASKRGEGIALARKLGMKEISFPGDIEFRYELDLFHAQHRVFQAYRQIIGCSPS